MSKQKNNFVVIYGTHVDLEHSEVKKVKSAKDIQALQLFSHLDDEDRASAEKELLQQLLSPKATAEAAAKP